MYYSMFGVEPGSLIKDLSVCLSYQDYTTDICPADHIIYQTGCDWTQLSIIVRAKSIGDPQVWNPVWIYDMSDTDLQDSAALEVSQVIRFLCDRYKHPD